MSDDFQCMPVFTSQPAKELNGVKPLLNPHTELTLKGNAEMAIAEVISMNCQIYISRIDAYWSYVFRKIRSVTGLNGKDRLNSEIIIK